MNIFYVIFILVAIGVALYLVNAVIPMVNWMKIVINAIVALLVCLWLLQIFHVVSPVIR